MKEALVVAMLPSSSPPSSSFCRRWCGRTGDDGGDNDTGDKTGMVDRAAPRQTDGDSDPICPVCVKRIGAKDRVSGHGENLMHEACDYVSERPSDISPRRG